MSPETEQIPGIDFPSHSTRNLNFLYGSNRCELTVNSGMFRLLAFVLRKNAYKPKPLTAKAGYRMMFAKLDFFVWPGGSFANATLSLLCCRTARASLCGRWGESLSLTPLLRFRSRTPIDPLRHPCRKCARITHWWPRHPLETRPVEDSLTLGA